ncbi:hypothetical protein BUALT_Bualt01G0032100 [Buddleja alternifolia]|uniref:Transcription repressor n=1 Tax=Buddleja alternifolia TaxID=168488 RepID=A0AAV6Y5F8_9LAMI|nr:hypothetical protein BUALT_Bualt01G0032100 [Buddleja alternifolia]
MAKGPKLRLSFLNSFQMCRPKDPSSLVKNPLPAVTYFYSPINSKSFDISFPGFPDPPPSTPRDIGSSKITPVLNDEFSSHACHEARKENKEKTYKSKVSSEFNERARPMAASRNDKKKEKTERKASNNTKTSLADINETELSSPIIEEEPLNGSRKPLKQRSVRTQRFKRYGSKDWQDDSITAPENEPRGKIVDGKGNQSFVVVKRSVDPYKDFKKSMLEMILERQMFEPEQLEQLLMSFLSLNSRMHHKVILQAFTEIWKEIFRSPN